MYVLINRVQEERELSIRRADKTVYIESFADRNGMNCPVIHKEGLRFRIRNLGFRLDPDPDFIKVGSNYK